MSTLIPVRAKKCATCPFRKDSEYAYLAGELSASALTEASRICHSTGENGLRGNTGKPDRLCRGARNVQIDFFYAVGFIDQPTDEAWYRKLQEIENAKVNRNR